MRWVCVGLHASPPPRASSKVHREFIQASSQSKDCVVTFHRPPFTCPKLAPQLTIWGYSGALSDYAAKHWSGLVGDYYFGRWNLLLLRLTAAVSSGTPMDFPYVSLLRRLTSTCKSRGHHDCTHRHCHVPHCMFAFWDHACGAGCAGARPRLCCVQTILDGRVCF